ncbi:hypothetical protein D3C81_930220 [compost metagenome]
MHLNIFQHVATVVRKGGGVHRDAVAQAAVAQVDHPPVIIVTVDDQIHPVTCPGILPADGAGHHLMTHIQFAAVQDVIRRHIINADGVVCLGVQHHGAVIQCGHFIPRLVVADHRHHHPVTAFLQRARRDRHLVAQMAVVIHHCAGKRLSLHADGHHIARPGVRSAHLATDHCRHTIFCAVDHVIRGHRADIHPVFSVVVEMYGVGADRHRHVTRRIL